MKISTTPINGAAIIETTKHADLRGEFLRAFCQEELSTIIGERQIVQINISKTHLSGAVRGMHYQRPPQAEMKLIRCIKGKVWDVLVDLRTGSSTFLQWYAEELSPDNARMMIIPEGCAHGFQTLEPDSELLYLHTAPYTPELEGGVLHNDPRLSIPWPLPVADLSPRDRSFAMMSLDYSGISI